MKWAIGNGLGLIPKDGPKTCYHNFDLLRKEGLAPLFWYSPQIKFEWELGGLCTHDEFYMHQVPLADMAVFRQTWALRYGAKCSADRATTTLKISKDILFDYAVNTVEDLYNANLET